MFTKAGSILIDELRAGGSTWYGSKPGTPFCSHQNSWDLWMFIPLKMVLISIDPYPYPYHTSIKPPSTMVLRHLLSRMILQRVSDMNLYPLVICYIAMEAMAHRNRSFSQRTKPTFILGIFHGYVSHNQMVNLELTLLWPQF